MGYEIDTVKLKRYIDENYGSINDFAKVVGVSRAYVWQVLTGRRNGGGKMIAGLLSLGMTRDDIFLPSPSASVNSNGA